MAGQIDREAVKVLAIAVGLREAARRLGLKEDRVRQWSARDPNGSWFAHSKPARDNRIKPAVTEVSPAQAYQAVLEAKRNNVKHNLAKYCENGSKVAEKSRKPLAIAQNVNHLASVMAKVWPEQQASGTTGPLSLNVLCGNAAIQVNAPEQDTP